MGSFPLCRINCVIRSHHAQWKQFANSLAAGVCHVRAQMQECPSPLALVLKSLRTFFVTLEVSTKKQLCGKSQDLIVGNVFH